MPKILTTGQKAYRKWYNQNKKEFNAKRAQKYREDSETRQKILDYQNEYRKTHSRPSMAGARNVRFYKGKKYEVFRIGHVAEYIGLSEQTIRGWERKELIPLPSFKSAHRYYSKGQIELLKEFAELSAVTRWQPKLREIAIPKKVGEIKSVWATA